MTHHRRSDGSEILQYLQRRSATADCLCKVSDTASPMRLFSQRGKPCPPAPWDARPLGFLLGAGPTIHHARGSVSTREEDVALVTAAARGDSVEVAELLPRASSPNVRSCAKGASGNGSIQGHTTTALHAAAAVGALDVVRVLLEGGADPCARQSGLRILRPLHEASTLEVAEALLSASAAPTALDPREPDLSWYHRQHKRPEVADLILAVARQQQQSGSIGSTPASSSSVGAPSKVFPSMTSAEIASAMQAWGADGGAVRALLRRLADRSPQDRDGHCRRSSSLSPSRLSSLSEEDLECAICMVDIADEDACVLLPCGGNSSHNASCGGNSPCNDSPVHDSPILNDLALNGSSSVRRPHVFHAECLTRWWMKSCRCPTCRRDVRQWLKTTPTPRSRKRPPTLPVCQGRHSDKILSDGCMGIAVRQSPSSAGGFRSTSKRRASSTSKR